MDRDEQELVPPIEQEQTLGGPIGVPTPEESIQPLESAEDRSSLRKKRVTLTTFSSGIATALTILSFMITVPLTIRYLGNERYGIWLTLGGLTNLLGLADLGMGFSIQNAISKADGEGDVDRISTICSSGALSLIFAAVLLTVVGVGVIEIVPLQKMFNVHSPLAISELKPSAIVFLLCFSGSIVTSLVLRVQKGLQLGYVTNAWQSASALVGLVTVVTAALLKANLPVLLFCSFGTPLLVATLNGIVFFSRPIRGAMINGRSESRAVT
jgi:O-antigen/teichoic acid export membrane protein